MCESWMDSACMLQRLSLTNHSKPCRLNWKTSDAASGRFRSQECQLVPLLGNWNYLMGILSALDASHVHDRRMTLAGFDLQRKKGMLHEGTIAYLVHKTCQPTACRFAWNWRHYGEDSDTWIWHACEIGDTYVIGLGTSPMLFQMSMTEYLYVANINTISATRRPEVSLGTLGWRI